MASTAQEHVTLSSPDISCGHCVATVQEEVGKLDGVYTVQASAETKLVDIDFDPAVVSVEKIAIVMNDAGYPVNR